MMGTKQYDNALDLITFSRASNGTSLRKISYGSELAPNLDTWSRVGDAATTLTYNSGDGSLDVDAATVLDGASVNAGLTTGKVYLFEADITLGTSTNARVTVGPGYTVFSNITASGVASLIFVAQDQYIRIDSYVSTGTFTINSVSVREVLFDQPDGTLTLFNHPDDIPRIDYNADGTVKGLLIEEQRTNLFTYSQPISSGFGLIRASLATSSVIAPDGNTAEKLIEDNTAANSHFLSTGSIGMSLNTTYTISWFAKAAERSFIAMNIYSGTTSYWTWFNLSNGTVGSATNSPVTFIEDYGDGWYRCGITVTTAASGTPNTATYISNSNGSLAYDGDGTSGIYIYGGQLEAGAFPTSYIPTSGASATREPDIASIPVTDFGYNQKAGSLVVDVDTFDTNYGNWVWVLDGADDVSLYGHGAATGWRLFGSGGTIGYFGTLPENADAIIGYAYSHTGSCGLIDGGTVTSVNHSQPVAVTTVRIGAVTASSGFLNGHIKSIQYYPRRLTNAQLQELTA